MELNEYTFEIHFINCPYIVVTRLAVTQWEALLLAEQDYKDETGFSAVICVDPNKI